MPATDCQGSSAAPFTHIGRSILSLRRDQAVHSMDNDNNASAHELEIESFQRKVSDRFLDLSSGPDELLSLAWVQKLLGLFLDSQDEFRVILFNNKSQLHKAPMDRLIAEYFERSVKALDVCNAIRDGIEQIRQWQKLIEIVLVALENQRMLGEGQIRRAKKAVIDLAISMLDEKDSGTTLAHRNRSFGRNNTKDNQHNRSLGHFRSLSWSVSRSWSAARQLQAIGYNLYAPRGNEVVATNGLAGLVFTMSSVLLFVMWALVAAIPCQDRGLQVHFPLSRQFQWAGPMMVLHERILEESKKRERRNACGLMREIYQIEKSTRLMNELLDSVQFPITEEKEVEVRQRVKEFSVVCETLKEGLDPLERQVRDVFHRIVRGRTEGLDCLGRIEN